jgi:hypothetical protein
MRYTMNLFECDFLRGTFFLPYLLFASNHLNSVMEKPTDGLPEVNFYRWDEHILDLATSKDEILKILMTSKENGNTIGIKSDPLGDGFVMTAVDDILLEDGGETIIILKRFDITGFMLPTNMLPLQSIKAACPLMSEFKNPVLKNLDKSRSWFF